jgi:cysteine-rich repeat protein
VGAACDPLYACQRCEGGGLCPTDAPTCGRNVCGDGLPGLDEACDDGNLNPGDGCSPACELERLPRPFEVNGPSEFIEVADDATDWVALQVPRAGYLRISYGFDDAACLRVDEPLLFLRARQPDDTWFTVWPPFPDQQLPQNGCINGFEVNVPAGVYRLLIDSPASGASGMLSAQVSDF